MDIAVLSTTLSQANIKQQANLSLMKKAMNNKKVEMDGMLQMMNKSVSREKAMATHLGNRIDIKA